MLEIGPKCHERFVNPDKVPELAQIDINLAGVSRLEGHYRVGHKDPDYHTVSYTTGGQGLLHSQSGSISVEPNSLMILPAGQPHLFELKGYFWATTWFAIDATSRWDNLNRNSASVEYCRKAQVICHLMSQMYYEEEKALRETQLKQLEYYLISTLMAPGVQYNQLNRFDALFRDVENQLHYPWTIEKMSERIHYSAPHLHRLCQQAYGRSPIQQLIYLRMQRAQHLLIHTDWSMMQIAGAVGYKDVFNFANRFKKSIGETPAVFRKMHAKRALQSSGNP